MKQHSKQHLDKLTRDILDTAGMEQAGDKFTDNIMSNIEGLELEPLNQNSPLISTTAWVVIGSVFISLLAYSVFLQPSGVSWFEQNEMIKGLRETNILDSINLSQTFVLSAVVFAILFIFQIGLMKAYFNKRLQY